jgi:acetyl-CoA synthetase (ADP-forming)
MAMNRIFSPGERAASRISIDRVLHPESVAVLGASDSIAKFGGRIMHFLTRHGFAGHVYPINLRRDTVAGRKAYPKIGAVPSPPDVAIMAVPTDTLVDSLREVADAGVGCSVIITNGFAESGDAEGVARQQEIVRISHQSGMRVIGPNCMGIIVPHHHMALCSSVVLDTDSLGDGSIGLVSQSGALMVSLFDRAKTDGIGLRYGVSVGNQSDLEICDFVEYMIEDERTEAICLYIEGLVDGGRFRDAAAASRRAGKPLFVVKTGRTEAGVVAARSHTASLAGSHEAFAAICREYGVIEAGNPDDMIRAAYHLTRAPKRHAARGVAIISSSGGSAGIASDRLSEEGLEIAVLAPETLARVEEMLLPAQARNPIDLGGRIVPETTQIDDVVTRLVMDDPNVGYGIAILTSMPDYANRSRLIAKSGTESGKPFVVAFAAGAAADKPRQEVRKEGVVYLDSFEDGLRVLKLLSAHGDAVARPATSAARPEGLPGRAEIDSLSAGYQTESRVKALLASYGLKVPQESPATSPDAAADAASGFNFPVVLKAVSPDIVHKSDVGGVKVGLTGAEAVREAAHEMAARIGREMPEASIQGYSVQEMIGGEAEILIGVRRDPQFGPIVLVGMGGVAVEIMKDVVVAPAPVSRERALRMVDELRMSPLLKGARGRPPVDLDAIADAVERVSWLASDLGSRLVDLEVNPLIVRAAGRGAVAVDGRATLSGG